MLLFHLEVRSLSLTNFYPFFLLTESIGLMKKKKYNRGAFIMRQEGIGMRSCARAFQRFYLRWVSGKVATGFTTLHQPPLTVFHPSRCPLTAASKCSAALMHPEPGCMHEDASSRRGEESFPESWMAKERMPVLLFLSRLWLDARGTTGG